MQRAKVVATVVGSLLSLLGLGGVHGDVVGWVSWMRWARNDGAVWILLGVGFTLLLFGPKLVDLAAGKLRRKPAKPSAPKPRPRPVVSTNRPPASVVASPEGPGRYRPTYGGGLDSALREQLRKGVDLRDAVVGIPALRGTGLRETTSLDVDEWERETAALLDAEPLQQARFLSEPPTPFFGNILPDGNLQLRLDHRLKQLDEVIKGF